MISKQQDMTIETHTHTHGTDCSLDQQVKLGPDFARSGLTALGCDFAGIKPRMRWIRGADDDGSVLIPVWDDIRGYSNTNAVHEEKCRRVGRCVCVLFPRAVPLRFGPPMRRQLTLVGAVGVRLVAVVPTVVVPVAGPVLRDAAAAVAFKLDAGAGVAAAGFVAVIAAVVVCKSPRQVHRKVFIKKKKERKEKSIFQKGGGS